MDYQCIVIYTIVRICPFYPYTTEFLQSQRRKGCFAWFQARIKRYNYADLVHILFVFFTFVQKLCRFKFAECVGVVALAVNGW